MATTTITPDLSDGYDVEKLDLRALVREAAVRHDVPPDLAEKLMLRESSGNARALSPKGAYGPMQLMGPTARSLGVNRYDPKANIDGGVRYLAAQLQRFGEPRLAVAAYNAGPEAVAKYGDVPPYKETQAYVKAILGDGAKAVTPDLDGGFEVEPAGLKARGNIDLHHRPVVKNKDGTISTVRSITIDTDRGAVLIPTVVGDKVVSNAAAIAHYKQTGEHLGVFKDSATADAYAESLHEDQAKEYGPKAAPAAAPPPADDGGMTPDLSQGFKVLPGKLTVMKPSTRTLADRFTETTADAFLRNPTIAHVRRIASDPDRAGLELDPASMPGMVDEGLVGAAKLARALGLHRPKILDAKSEKERRELYEARAAEQPFYKAPGDLRAKAVAGLVTGAGEVVGGAADPANWIGGGKTLLERGAASIGSNVAGDVATQIEDLKSGVQDKYNAAQTALAGAVAVPIHLGGELASHAGRAEIGAKLKKLIFGEDLPPVAKGAEAPAPAPAPAMKPEEAVKPGSGSVVNAKTGQAYTAGQTAAFEHMRETGDFDEAADWGTRQRPIAQVEPDVLPSPGIWYVDLAGHVVQAPDRPEIELPPEARAPEPEKAPEAVPPVSEPPVAREAAEALTPVPEAEAMTPDLEAGFEVEPDHGADFDRMSAPRERAPEPAPEAKAPDRIDAALEAIRDEKSSKPMNGPRLSDWLMKNGRLKDERGELSAMFDLKDPHNGRIRRLRSNTTGMDLDRAAQAAQEAGYIGKPDLGERATPQDLLDALKRDIDEAPVHSSHHEPRADADFRRLMGDLADEMAFHGIDPQASDVRAQLEDAWKARDLEPEYQRHAEEHGELSPEDLDTLFGAKKAKPGEDQPALPGVEARNETAEAIAQERLRRDRIRKAGDAGPLFDETARAQTDLFDAEAPAKPKGAEQLDLLGAKTKPKPPPFKPGRGLEHNPGLREAPIATPKARADAAKAEPLPKDGRRVEQLAERLRRALKLTHRQGRLSLKGENVAGQYNPRTDVIRTRHVHELDAVSHEGFHALDFKAYPALRAARDAHAAELIPLDYAPVDPKVGPRPEALMEGFAEFGRLYLTNPDVARRVAPKFFDAFAKAMRADAPKALETLVGIQRDYRKIMTAPSADRVKGAIVTLAITPLRETARRVKALGVRTVAGELSRQAYTAAFDDVHPISLAVERLRQVYRDNLGQGLDLKVIDHAYKIARLAKDAFNRGKMMIENGVIPRDGVSSEGPSLSEALADALGGKFFGWHEDELESFGAYLVGRRMVDEWDRFNAGKVKNEPHYLGQDDWAQANADFEAANPSWRGAADKVNLWTQAMWKLRYEAGFLTRKAYLDGVKEHPFYVPLNRDVSEKNARLTGAPTRDGGADDGGSFRFGGSTRDFVNPIQMMMRESYELTAMMAANDARVALMKLGERAGRGGGEIIEVIPNTDLQTYNIAAEEAADKLAERFGLDSGRDLQTLLAAVDIDADLSGSLAFHRRTPTEPRGEPIIFAWEKGERRALRLADGDLGKAMYQAFVGMPRSTHDILSAGLDVVVSPVSRALRYGVTADPAFMLANLLRDAIATWVVTDVGFKPVLSTTRGLADEITLNGITKEYAAFGGIMGGAQTASAHHARSHAGRDMNALAPGKGVKRWASPAYLTEISETGTRLAVYRLGRYHALMGGYSATVGALVGAYAARDYMDFGRHGSLTGSISRVIPFFNAALQGSDKFVRVLAANGKLLAKAGSLTPAEARARRLAARAWVKTLGLGLAGLALSHHYRDDDDYKDFNEYARAKNWMVKIDDIPLLREAMNRAGASTEWVWLALPKPFEQATFSNVFERAYEGLRQKDPTAWAKMGRGLADLWTPPTDIPLFQMQGEVRANRTKDGRPIVPDHKLGLDPEEQTNSYTSRVAKIAAKAMGDATQAMSRTGFGRGVLGMEEGERRSFSPAVAEHEFLGVTGSLGREALKLSDRVLEGGKGPAVGLDDTVITARFFKDPARGAQSSQDFWSRMKEGGQLTAGAKTFTEKYNRDAKEGFAFLAGMSEARRDYALADRFGKTVWPKGRLAQEGATVSTARMLHPMVRAQAVQSVISDLREQVRDDTVANAAATGKLALSKVQRRDADDVLTHLGVAEMRDALIMVDARGYANQSKVDVSALRAKLAAVDPELPKVLDALYAAHAGNQGGRIPPQAEVARLWPKLQLELRVMGAQEMSAALLRARTRTRAGRAAEARRLAGETPDDDE